MLLFTLIHLTWLQQASANFIQRPKAGQCVTQHESVSQTTRHYIPTSQNDTTAHLAHTSVQSRASLFSPHYSASNSAITTNTLSSHVPLPTPGLHTLHAPTAQGFQQRTCVPAHSAGCGLYNLKQSLMIKLKKPDDNHLPTWFENAESRFLSAGVSTEEDRFNLFRDALSDEHAWGKFVSDAAGTHSPYTHVKNALIKLYERRARHRLFEIDCSKEIHNLRLKDGESYVDFTDRLIATAGHDWETNPLKCNEIRIAFLQVLPTELFWKLNGLHDRDLLQLAADADASIHDSCKHAMYQHNADAGSFPNLFSQSQSQSSHGGAGDAFSKQRSDARDPN